MADRTYLAVSFSTTYMDGLAPNHTPYMRNGLLMKSLDSSLGAGVMS